MAEVSIPNFRNLMVSSNELFLRETINRTLDKLIENDVYLKNKINSYGTAAEFSILPYRKDYVYNTGDVVVYIDEKNGEIKNIYLLECLIDNNSEEPAYDIIDGFVSDFTKTNWKNLNDFFSIYNSTDSEINLSNFLEFSISSNFALSHENDPYYHKFGEIHADTISDKLLKNDFSNVGEYRSQLFWAHEVKKVSSNNFTGVYKKWGNGVLEYDLTYCLGENLKVEKTIDSDGNIVSINLMKANSLIPLSSEEFSNDDYFMTDEDYTIFNKVGSSQKYNVNGIAQTNINSKVNVYHGTIVFPIPFADENYMIFTSDRARSSNGKAQSPNTVTFTNRKKESITAVYAIPNYNSLANIEEVLLRNNVFQCQIIGRWK